jgi:hypothetical protein
VYPDPRVAGFIGEHFIPLRAHVKTDQDVFARFNAQWTPTIAIVGSDEKEQHRIEGYLPVEDFLPQLKLGAAHAARARGDWSEAEKLYEELTNDPSPDIAAEAIYWRGVTKYKATNDPSHLGATGVALRDRFGGSTWAKKSSIWLS